ncbi:RNA-binding protein [Diplocarpon rosae]|nr:RNA-binding protein [Diplocarpon rosae]
MEGKPAPPAQPVHLFRRHRRAPSQDLTAQFKRAPIFDLVAAEKLPGVPVAPAPASTSYSSLLRARRGIPVMGQWRAARPPSAASGNTHARAQLSAEDDIRTAY